jgi:GH25 family lysozyme M1 (1,4-beta-N-acetylmuramidase)
MQCPDRRRVGAHPSLAAALGPIVLVVAAILGVVTSIDPLPAAAATSTSTSTSTSTPATSTSTSTAPPPTNTAAQPAGGPGTPRAGDPTPGASANPAASPNTGPITGPVTNAATPGGLPGIDVANFQHPNGAAIDWNAVAASGRRYALVKATEGPIGTSCTGPTYTNPYFRSDYDGAGAAGMWRGAYHFAHPRLPITTADDEAQQFFSVAGAPGVSRELPPVLDLEQTCGLSPADTVAWTREWLQRVKALTGERPIIYTGFNFWQTALGGDTSLANAGYPLWMARYQASAPQPLPGGWVSWAFWQWTSSGSVPGIAATTDLDVYNGDETGLQALVVASKEGDTPSIAVGRDLDGRIEVLWVDSFGTLWQRWETSPGGAWSAGFVRWSASPVVRTALTRNVDGRLEAFAIRRDGGLMHSWQTCAGCGWSGWYDLAGGNPGTALAATANADGHLEVITRQGDGTLIHTWQVCPGCGFVGPWYGMAPAGQGQVAVALNQDGRLEVFATSSSTLSHMWQVMPNGGWSAWYGLAAGSDSSTPPTATAGSDGRLSIGWRNSYYGTAVMDRQSCAGCGWDAPVLAPIGAIASGPVLSTGGSGTFVAACGSGAVNDAQLGPSGQWTAMSTMPATACRNVVVLGDRPGPLIFVWADNLLAATPGHTTAAF